jgi:hypothetical protein
MSKYKAIKNHSWGEMHKWSFGDREGFVIVEDVDGLPVVATVINRFGENPKVTESRAKFIEYCLNHQSEINHQQ